MLLLRVYCCTPSAVLAAYLSRWRQNVTLPSIVYWRSLHFIPYVTMIGHWARKFNDLGTRILSRNFATTTLWLNRTTVNFFRGSYSTKNPVLSEKTWLYLSKRPACLLILVIQPASIFCNRLICLLTKIAALLYLRFSLSEIAESRARYK